MENQENALSQDKNPYSVESFCKLVEMAPKLNLSLHTVSKEPDLNDEMEGIEKSN